MRVFRILMLILQVGLLPKDNPLLNPDFEIATEAGNQVFREELSIALSRTPDATPATRRQLKAEAENLAAELLRKGQKANGVPRKKLTIYWDSIRPIETASMYADVNGRFDIHFNEIMFFSHHDDHLKLVIPHEVAHLVYYQVWGPKNFGHDVAFDWIVKSISPNYQYKDLDITPACRLSARLLRANGNIGSSEGCEK